MATPVGPHPESDPAPDPYDLAALLASVDGAGDLSAWQPPEKIPVRTPARHCSIRTHPDPAYWRQICVITLGQRWGHESEYYAVLPELCEALEGERTLSRRVVVPAVTIHADPFLWPIRLYGPRGEVSRWGRSALEAAQAARAAWVCVRANQSRKRYEWSEADGDIPEPDWPRVPLRDLLEAAFRDRVIDTLDHPVLRDRRGAI